MVTEPLNHLREALLVQLCYQFFITPIHIPLEKKYREYAERACEFVEGKRTEVIHHYEPRHFVIHRFQPQANPGAKKILITHGWISRAAYMVKLIKVLYQQGYDVYALDFPAHGDSNGLQLLWTEAVSVIKNTINAHGPFYGLIGHSFGGSMILNAINLAGQLPEWGLEFKPEKAVLIASPTCMRSPIKSIAKMFKLNGSAFLQLRQLIRQQAEIDLSHIRLEKFLAQDPHTPFLCIHGELDQTVPPSESIRFCNKYKNAQLSLLPKASHVSVLFDERVEQLVSEFLDPEYASSVARISVA